MSRKLSLLREFIGLAINETSATTGIETTTHAFWLWPNEPVKNYPYKGMHFELQWSDPPPMEKVRRPKALDTPGLKDVTVFPFTSKL